MALALAGSAIGSTVSGSTLSVGGFSTTTTNCVVIAAITSLEGNSVVSISGGGLTWLPYLQGSWAFSYPQEFWYAVSSAQQTSITVTATLTNSVSGPGYITCFGVSGANTGSPFDGNASVPNQTHTNLVSSTRLAPSAPFSTNNPNTFIFGQLTTYQSPGTITEPTGYTSISDSIGGGISVDVGYDIVSSRQSNISPTYTWSSATTYQGVIWGAIQSNQLYSGIASAPNRGNGTLQLTVGNPGGGTSPYTYQWYRSTTSGFTPGAGNIVVGATAQTLNDSGLTNGTTYYYVCIVTDSAAATANSNQTSGTPGNSSVFGGGFIGI